MQKRALLDEALAYPGVLEQWRTREPGVTSPPLFTTVFAKDDIELRFFSTITTFGMPHDVTLDELRIECMSGRGGDRGALPQGGLMRVQVGRRLLQRCRCAKPGSRRRNPASAVRPPAIEYVLSALTHWRSAIALYAPVTATENSSGGGVYKRPSVIPVPTSHLFARGQQRI